MADEDFKAIWFHGHISREEAEKRLNGRCNGAFLIRESTNFPGDYTLCLLFCGKVEHYRITRKNSQFTCDDEAFFDTLHDLINHYTLDADGLCHNLISPIPRSNFIIDQQCGGKHSASNIIDSDNCDHAVVSNNNDRFCSKDSQANFDEWTKRLRDAGYAIYRRDLKLGDCIGKGEFGDVLIGWLREKKVAVKVLKDAGQVVRSFLQEAVLMASLKHENLVQLMGVVLDDSASLFIIVEYMPNGNLVDYLRSRGRQQVTLKQQLNFAYDTCSGMAYLESRNMVHRDLAARNVLLSETMVAKVSDFGLAKKVDLEAQEEAQGKFPIKWTAPEALRHSQFTSKSDVWSYGVFLWEIYSFGRIPYPRIPVQDVVRHIEKGYRMEAPECCPSGIVTIMFSCWDIDPAKRPSFKQLLYSLKTIDCVEI